VRFAIRQTPRAIQRGRKTKTKKPKRFYTVTNA